MAEIDDVDEEKVQVPMEQAELVPAAAEDGAAPLAWWHYVCGHIQKKMGTSQQRVEILEAQRAHDDAGAETRGRGEVHGRDREDQRGAGKGHAPGYRGFELLG